MILGFCFQSVLSVRSVLSVSSGSTTQRQVSWLTCCTLGLSYVGQERPVLASPEQQDQTAVVWSCFPSIRSGQNHLARHSERGKKTRRTKEEVGRQHQGMDRPGVRQVPEGSGEQRKMEKTGCKIIYGAPTALAVKGLMMMMMMIMMMCVPVSRRVVFLYANIHRYAGT